MNTPGLRVFVHVGAPKTGTSQLQDLLFRNREVLREHGVLYPGICFDDHFMAAIDLLGKQWGGLEERAKGAWQRLLAEVECFDGHTVVVSHEVLAGATAEQARQALAALPGEVHVICSARDLRRQVPAEWQEGVKHRRTLSYAEFCADITSRQPRTELARWFWRVQNVPAVLSRWSDGLPPERVHLVTVPPPGADPELLIERFLALLGIEQAWLPATTDRANASMGAVETTVVRRLNQRLPASELPGEVYRPYVRELLVHRTLAGRPEGVRIALPAQLDGWVEESTRGWLEQLREAGYDVVGDLAELAPSPPQGQWYDPDAAPADEQIDVLLEMTETLVRELAAQDERHRAELQAIYEAANAPPPPGPWMRFKQRFVGRTEGNRALEAAYRAYRTLRRR